MTILANDPEKGNSAACMYEAGSDTHPFVWAETVRIEFHRMMQVKC